MELTLIQKKIHVVRNQNVMLDFDLARLYEVETRILNQAIKRNIDSFPEDFMFRLSVDEWQMVQTSAENTPGNLKSQNVMSSWGGRRGLPYAFTEHGVTMLASVLKSPKARKMNIAIVRAFIALKKIALYKNDILDQLKELKDRIGEHDVQLNQIYDAIENLLDEKQEQKKWEERERIGFRKPNS
jgi:hypothetical protein